MIIGERVFINCNTGKWRYCDMRLALYMLSVVRHIKFGHPIPEMKEPEPEFLARKLRLNSLYGKLLAAPGQVVHVDTDAVYQLKEGNENA